MTTQMARLSASIPKYIIDETDKIATMRNLSRSKLVAECLHEMIQRKKRELLIEGYKTMAEKHSDFAALSLNASKEVLPIWE